MSGALLTAGDDGPARCAICGDEAVGPCARCQAPTCGDCCVLTEGGTRTYAVCLRCEKKGGKSITSGWVLVVAWIAVPTVGIAILLVLLGVVARACR